MNIRKELPRLEEPLNASERGMYNIALRLDRIIEILESMIDVNKSVDSVDKVEIIASEIIKEPVKRTSKKSTK